MDKYLVSITRTSTWDFIVEAESPEEARDLSSRLNYGDDETSAESWETEVYHENGSDVFDNEEGRLVEY